MNKAELVKAIAGRVEGASTRQVDRILSIMTSEIMAAVAEGNKVTLVGFGTFEKRHRNERSGRDISTGESITIPAIDVPRFSPGKQFKEMVKGG